MVVQFSHSGHLLAGIFYYLSSVCLGAGCLLSDSELSRSIDRECVRTFLDMLRCKLAAKCQHLRACPHIYAQPFSKIPYVCVLYWRG